MAVQLGFVQKSGSWFSMGEVRIGQGRDAAKQYLKDNPDVAEKLEADIRANASKLTGTKGTSRSSSKASGKEEAASRSSSRGVDVSAEDFEDAED